MRQQEQQSARTKIDDLITGLGDWRGDRLAQVRQGIRDALPEVAKTWKCMGSPVWEQQDGIIVVGNAHKAKVKLTFPQGARLADPGRLFNAGRRRSVVATAADECVAKVHLSEHSGLLAGSVLRRKAAAWTT